MLRPWTRSKKLRRACGGNPREACTRHIGRGLVSRRDAGGPKEQAHLSLARKGSRPVPPTINGPNRLICLVRSVPNVEPAPPSCCRLATAKPCSSISTRSQPKSPSERTPLSSLIRPAGMAPRPSRFQTTSRSCSFRRAHPNSTARKTSGSSCVRIGCQTGFSNPSTISSTTAATLGTHSSTNPGRLCPSRDATGQQSVTQSEDWYYLSGKRLQLLKEIVPGLSSIAVMSYGANPQSQMELRETQIAAQKLDLQVHSVPISADSSIENAFEKTKKETVQALIVVTDPILFSQRSQILALAAGSRLPAMYPYRAFSEAGGLISYAPNDRDVFRPRRKLRRQNS